MQMKQEKASSAKAKVDSYPETNNQAKIETMETNNYNLTGSNKEYVNLNPSGILNKV